MRIVCDCAVDRTGISDVVPSILRSMKSYLVIQVVARVQRSAAGAILLPRAPWTHGPVMALCTSVDCSSIAAVLQQFIWQLSSIEATYLHLSIPLHEMIRSFEHQNEMCRI